MCQSFSEKSNKNVKQKVFKIPKKIVEKNRNFGTEMFLKILSFFFQRVDWNSVLTNNEFSIEQGYCESI